MTNRQQKANILLLTHPLTLRRFCQLHRGFDNRVVPVMNLKQPTSGSLNWVIFIVFEDEIEWVLQKALSCRRMLQVVKRR